ncbi:MAG: hypothetical protein Q9206_002099, partial [Seirophora lacunosa]
MASAEYFAHALMAYASLKLDASMAAQQSSILDPIWSYRERFRPFAEHGDAFLVVTPWGLYMANASPTLIHQIATRRTDWVKPVEHYSVIEHFGPNVVTTEGSTWRDHRKVSSGAFNERSNAVVWRESKRQAEEMISVWGRREGNTSDVAEGKAGMWVGNVYPDAATTSLHVISRTGFGVRLLWEGEEMEEGEKVEEGYERFTSHVPTRGHTMTFKESIHTMLRDVIWMGLFSRGMLKKLPFKRTRKVWEAYTELNDYLHELLALKKAAIANGLTEKDTLDLMVPLITSPDPSLPTLSLLGNAFIFMLAGHETTANSITYLLILLALNPHAQRRLHRTLDALLPAPGVPWPYPSLFHTLGNSYLGACINEQLRLLPSIPMIPKRSSPSSNSNNKQTLILDTGDTITLPANTFQHFCCHSVHCNPRYWPHSPTSARNPSATDDLADFVPERWMRDDSHPSSSSSSASSAKHPDNNNNNNNNNNETTPHIQTVDELQDLGGNDIGTSALFTPPRGAFIPFSDGARGCLGRRFAMVELVAVAARIFRDYAVELDVRPVLGNLKTGDSERAGGVGGGGTGGWAEDIIRGMGSQEKKEVYDKA